MRTTVLAIIACCGLAACQTGYPPASFQLAKQPTQVDHTRAAEPGEMVSDAGGALGIVGLRFA